MTIHRETLEGTCVGDLLPRVLELTQAAVDRAEGYHVHVTRLPDGRARIEVATWKEDGE